MCFSAQQPAAPIKTPSYSPEDMDKNFSMTMTDEESGQITKSYSPQATMKPAVTGKSRTANVL